MDSRIAVISIIVEDSEQAEQVNNLLHSYAKIIVGRMGIPLRDRGISIISIVVDSCDDSISALSGKLGRLPGVTAKASYSKVPNTSTQDKLSTEE